MTHLKLANSPLMAVLCGLTILIVLLQPVIFMAAAFKRGKELNMTKEEMKEAARSSAIFSIIPSLPIIVSYLLLVPALGRYFPWLRLSVVGSAVYETMVANMAAEAFGLESITAGEIPVDVFVFILFVVTIGILGGNIFNVFFLKSYDKKVESLKSGNAALVPIITTAMFLGMYGTMAAPHLTNFSSLPAVAAILVSGVTAIGVNKLAAGRKKLKEFAFPLSMLVGMFGILYCQRNDRLGGREDERKKFSRPDPYHRQIHGDLCPGKLHGRSLCAGHGQSYPHEYSADLTECVSDPSDLQYQRDL